MKETIKKLVEIFLTCHFMISVTICICGMLLGPNTKLRYIDMLAPTIMAFLCTIPTLLTIHSEKLTEKKIFIRKIIQIILIEMIVFSMIHFGFDGINSMTSALTIAIAVLLVFIGVSLVDWARGSIEAQDLNRHLAQLQKVSDNK